MCLSRVTKIGPFPNKQHGYGYKVFDVKKGMLYSECIQTWRPRKVGVWLRASRPRIRICGVSGYPAGWHIFVFRKGPLAWGYDSESQCIVRVAYKGVLALGKQECCVDGKFVEVIVAEWMLILPTKQLRAKLRAST